MCRMAVTSAGRRCADRSRRCRSDDATGRKDALWGKKTVFCHCPKKIFGVLECGGSWTKCRLGHIGGVTVACKTYYVGLPIRSPDVDPVLQVEYKKIVSAAFA